MTSASKISPLFRVSLNGEYTKFVSAKNAEDARQDAIYAAKDNDEPIPSIDMDDVSLEAICAGTALLDWVYKRGELDIHALHYGRLLVAGTTSGSYGYSPFYNPVANLVIEAYLLADKFGAWHREYVSSRASYVPQDEQSCIIDWLGSNLAPQFNKLNARDINQAIYLAGIVAFQDAEVMCGWPEAMAGDHI